MKYLYKLYEIIFMNLSIKTIILTYPQFQFLPAKQQHSFFRFHIGEQLFSICVFCADVTVNKFVKCEIYILKHQQFFVRIVLFTFKTSKPF